MLAEVEASMRPGAVREIAFTEAIREALDQALERDPRVYVLGLGTTDPKGIFGTTLGLEAKYGSRRVMDMPTAENGMTGVAIGSALMGMRPVLAHQRIDFALLSLDQIVNNAAKWHYMFARKKSVPIVIRAMIGRGWGQGPQHSQSPQAMFAHFPGLKVLMPTTPHDAKGMLIAAIEDDDPVIFFEHRWLHSTFGPVPEEPYSVPIGKARTLHEGGDVSIIATSYMALEALRAAQLLAQDGIGADVVDVRTIKPLDTEHVLASVRKTGRMIAADTGWTFAGLAGELTALASERAFDSLKCAPRRVASPDVYVPTTHALADHYYPTALTLVNTARGMLGLAPKTEAELGLSSTAPRDVPDPSFRGPF